MENNHSPNNLTPKEEEMWERASTASEGPWSAFIEGDDESGLAGIVQPGRGEICFGCKPNGSPDFEDALFVAHARTDVPTLLMTISRLRKNIKVEIG